MSYSSVITSTTGLVGYWRLDETTGTTAADSSSPGTNTGTYTGGYTLGVAPRSAELGSAVAFNGSTGYVTVPTAAALQITGNVSVECWCKPALSTTGLFSALVAKPGAGSVTSPYTDYALDAHDGSGKFRFALSIGNTQRTLSGGAPIAANRWYHVVGTYDGANMRLYINGQPAASQAMTGAIDNHGFPLQIGRLIGGVYFNGAIDEAAVYNVALTPEAVAAHYAAAVAAPARRIKPTSPAFRASGAYFGCATYLAPGDRSPRNLADGSVATVVGTPTWQDGPYGPQLGGFAAAAFPQFPSAAAAIAYPYWWAALTVGTSTAHGWAFTRGLVGGSNRVGVIYNNTATGEATYNLCGSANVDVTAAGLPINDGQPHVLMGWSDSATSHHLAFDGVEVAAGSANPGTIAVGRLTLGGYSLGTTQVSDPFGGAIVAFLDGSGPVPDPARLAADLLSGEFSAVRPRMPVALLATSAPPATVYHAGGALSSSATTYYAF